ncbi:Translation repressor RelE [Operophtera brumata]|uniref:Translation repressor RelE n=1 Tax=Operophtera brumata TaxID=104452 RepID=A0A0L7LG08_OPEBR|nr:Translation repressor RelE [Operophtera brumata]
MKCRSHSPCRCHSNDSVVHSSPCRCHSNDSVVHSYHRIKHALRKGNPAAMILWAFHKIPSRNGITSRRVITFLKKRFRIVNNPEKTGKTIGAMLRYAVEFGLLRKRGTKYFLAVQEHH